jgi:aconitate hydratase
MLQLEPSVNGPFTPDLYNPISKLREVAIEKGWPLDVRVGRHLS